MYGRNELGQFTRESHDESYPHPSSPWGRAWRLRCKLAGKPDPYDLPAGDLTPSSQRAAESRVEAS